MYAIIGNSPWACEIRRSIGRAANVQSTVLIVGPSGTGKELIARAIHQQSRRSAGPLVAVDCTSIPAGLFASQLFGHVKGAFSGASCDTLGSFRAADGGTIFLDEIGELGLDLQAQLLRVIQDRAVTPVGHHRSLPVDVRIIAATNRDLHGDVAAGRFRLDLYYRLNVVKLTTTPLSTRPEDIEPLCHGFLERWSIENGLPHRRLSAAALQMLMVTIGRATCGSCRTSWNGPPCSPTARRSLPEHLLEALDSDLGPAIAGHVGASTTCLPRPRTLVKSAAWRAPRAAARGRAPGRRWRSASRGCSARRWKRRSQNQRAAARLLGIDWRLLSRKMHKYGISAPRRVRSA